jgi:hypothetical protein
MEIIVHCSASKWGNAIKINKWHLENGWSGIGYHAVILNGWIKSKVYNKNFNGLIESGRPFDDNNYIDPFEKGAHTRGKNDKIGVCLIGNSGKFSSEQLKGLETFIGWMREQFYDQDNKVSQHSDHDSKKPYCAGLSQEYIKKLNCLIQMS